MVSKITFQWDIKEVDQFGSDNGNVFLLSPMFSGKSGKIVHFFRLSLKESSPNYYCWFLRLEEPFQQPVQVRNLCFKAFDEENKEIYRREDADFHKFEHCEGWGYSKGIDCTKNNVKPFFKVSINFEYVNHTIYKSTLALGDDFLKLYKNQRSSDITVLCGSRVFKLHKSVLIARSSVFEAMLESKMKESISNTIPMHEFDPEVLAVVFEYIYSGVVSFPSDKLAGILDMSEQYDMADLKRICALEMAKNITVSNATELLILADTYGMAELKKDLVKFVGGNIREVMVTEGWKRSMKKDLKDDLLAFLA